MADRTTIYWLRFYSDGYDLSGYARNAGPFVCSFDEAPLEALTDAVKGSLPLRANMTPTVLTGNMDTTPTSGLHVTHKTPGVSRVIIAAQGMMAVPALGDKCYVGRYMQTGYQALEEAGAMTVTIPFGGWDESNRINYDNPWARLLQAYGARTAANSSTGIDDAAASALGGYMVYQVFAGDGTATISVDDSANNSAWSALSGATSGSIDCSAPSAGIVALGNTATVRRYLRWQLALGTATTVTFALAFVRATH
jgi:hypothetical protein